MEQTIQLLIVVASVAVWIIGAVAKNRKKAAEAQAAAKRAAAKRAQAGGAVGTAGAGERGGSVEAAQKSVQQNTGQASDRKSFGDILRELAEQAYDESTASKGIPGWSNRTDTNGGPATTANAPGASMKPVSSTIAPTRPASPTVAPRPIATPSWPLSAERAKTTGQVTKPAPSSRVPEEPTATSHDYYSLETEYDTMDGWGSVEHYGAEYAGKEYSGAERGDATRSSAEDAGAEGRYVGGEFGRGGSNRTSGVAGSSVGVAGGGKFGRGASAGSVSGGTKMGSDSAARAGDSAGDAMEGDNTGGTNGDAATRLAAVLGGEFDLRRAVIEAEILKPKYL
jgi:hypothetical protein